MTQLIVGNPTGFKTDGAFELDQVSVAIDIGTVANDPIVIEEIVITSPQITYELGSKGSNLDAIQMNVESYLGSQTKGFAKGETPKPGTEGATHRRGGAQERRQKANYQIASHYRRQD